MTTDKLCLHEWKIVEKGGIVSKWNVDECCKCNILVTDYITKLEAELLEAKNHLVDANKTIKRFEDAKCENCKHMMTVTISKKYGSCERFKDCMKTACPVKKDFSCRYFTERGK